MASNSSRNWTIQSLCWQQMQWLCLSFLLIFLGSCSSTNYPFKDGDIIFQNAQSIQCKAIELATGSKYTHVGILFRDDGEWMVYEAVGPVKITPLHTFQSRGQDAHFVVKRSGKEVNTELVKAYCLDEMGKDYDIYFNWDDTEIYCSELVWKAYKSANLSICDAQPLKSYTLTHPIVLETMKQRYGSDIPWEEKMVAPSDLFSSPLLETIYSNE